ncbi:alpha/beta fold hydrolase [Alteribacillus sp. JSM 102045]
MGIDHLNISKDQLNIEGKGPPVLFLHGLGMSKKVWEPIVTILSK